MVLKGFYVHQSNISLQGNRFHPLGDKGLYWSKTTAILIWQIT